MTVTYEVGESTGGGHLDIDFFVSRPVSGGGRPRRTSSEEHCADSAQVTEPRGDTIYTNFKQPQGTFSMSAERGGRYSYCFSNEMSSYSRKVLRWVVERRTCHHCGR